MASTISGVLTDAQTAALDSISSSSSSSSSSDASVLDQDAFLKLMMTELQYQDPLDPMDNTEYIAQMAQFSTVEQLYKVAEATQSSNELLSSMSTTIDSISSLINSMSSTVSTAISDGSDDQDTQFLYNEAILSQLITMNETLEAYVDSSEDEVTNEDILNAILDN